MSSISSGIPEKQPQRPSADGWSLDARSVVEVYTTICKCRVTVSLRFSRSDKWKLWSNSELNARSLGSFFLSCILHIIVDVLFLNFCESDRIAWKVAQNFIIEPPQHTWLFDFIFFIFFKYALGQLGSTSGSLYRLYRFQRMRSEVFQSELWDVCRADYFFCFFQTSSWFVATMMVSKLKPKFFSLMIFVLSAGLLRIKRIQVELFDVQKKFLPWNDGEVTPLTALFIASAIFYG